MTINFKITAAKVCKLFKNTSLLSYSVMPHSYVGQAVLEMKMVLTTKQKGG